MADFGTTGTIAGTTVPVVGAQISMYVAADRNNEYEIALEVSPDGGLSWFVWPQKVVAGGILTVTVAATHARARVYRAEAGATGTVFILSR